MILERKRVLIDASMTRSGGGFTYMVNMVPTLAQLAPKARFKVLLRSRPLADAIAPFDNVEIELLPQRGLAGRFAFLSFEAGRIARRFGADVYLSVADYAPLGAGCPVVVCLRNPNLFTTLEQGWGTYQKLRLGTLRRLATRSARRAARVVFVSEDSARWMGEAADLPAERRAVVHHGIDVNAWRRRGSEAASTAHGILSVSTIYRYKNFVRLIEAYRMLASRSEWSDRLDALPDLTIVGDDQDPQYSALMRAAREESGELAKKIHIVGSVPYHQVPAYYLGARIFVFPSYLETFGHPMLEAMASLLPVLASDIPVFREIGGSAAQYFDAKDVSQLAESLHELLCDDGLCSSLVERGRTRVADFTWRRSAEKLLQILTEVVDAG